MANHEPDTVEVAKWYTAARKIPSMIGRTPNGEKIPFGPFNVWALGTGAGIFAVGYRVLNLGMGSGLAPWALLVLVAVASGFMVDRIQTDQRNPISVITGFITAWTAPRTGRINGRALRIRTPRIAWGQVLIPIDAPAAAPAGQFTTQPAPELRTADAVPAAATPLPQQDPVAAPRKRPLRIPSLALATTTRATAAPSSTAAAVPAAASTSPAARPGRQERSIATLTGVQQLLASLPTDNK